VFTLYYIGYTGDRQAPRLLVSAMPCSTRARGAASVTTSTVSALLQRRCACATCPCSPPMTPTHTAHKRRRHHVAASRGCRASLMCDQDAGTSGAASSSCGKSGLCALSSRESLSDCGVGGQCGVEALKTTGDAGRGGEPVGEGDSWINEPSPTTLSISSVSCAGWRAVAGLPPTAPKTRRDGDAGRNDDGRGDGDRAGIPSSRISSAAGAVSGRVDVGD
jgi:hypothetical protein